MEGTGRELDSLIYGNYLPFLTIILPAVPLPQGSLYDYNSRPFIFLCLWNQVFLTIEFLLAVNLPQLLFTHLINRGNYCPAIIIRQLEIILLHMDYLSNK